MSLLIYRILCIFMSFFMEVATEPPMDRIVKLIPPHHLVWYGSNKAVSLSVKRHRPCSV